jgi:hypothetical protein
MKEMNANDLQDERDLVRGSRDQVPVLVVVVKIAKDGRCGPTSAAPTGDRGQCENPVTAQLICKYAVF